MADFATVEDLEAFWRPLTATEQTRATELLGYASALIRTEWPDIDDRIAEGKLDPALAKFVALSMVKRVLTAGDMEGVSWSSQTAGPYTTSATYKNPMGNLYLTGDERRLLSPTGRRAFTINTLAADAGKGLPYWDSES